MPNLTGMELADHLRGRDDGYAPLILLMNAAPPYPLPDHTRFLSKPFDGRTLLREVELLLAG
jgi:hypothetical protein